jgi:hypothetical protein
MSGAKPLSFYLTIEKLKVVKIGVFDGFKTNGTTGERKKRIGLLGLWLDIGERMKPFLSNIFNLTPEPSQPTFNLLNCFSFAKKER